MTYYIVKLVTYDGSLRYFGRKGKGDVFNEKDICDCRFYRTMKSAHRNSRGGIDSYELIPVTMSVG